MKMIIDGKKVESLSGETFDVINPATGKVIESVPKATAEDIDLAVTAAVKGQKEWAKTSVTQRADILHRFVEIVEQNKEMLAPSAPKTASRLPRRERRSATSASLSLLSRSTRNIFTAR